MLGSGWGREEVPWAEGRDTFLSGGPGSRSLPGCSSSLGREQMPEEFKSKSSSHLVSAAPVFVFVVVVSASPITSRAVVKFSMYSPKEINFKTHIC